VPEILLAGVRSRPLAGWLKGVGLLRALAGQADGDARLSWRGNGACVHTWLDPDALVRFLVETYRPPPVASPWNGGSGFFEKDKSAAAAVERVLATQDSRLEPLQRAIHAGREALRAAGLETKPEKEQRTELLRDLRTRLDDDALRWVDAAVVLREDEQAFPPLLGTGGNDGRWDIGGNFVQAVVAGLGLAAKRGSASAAELVRAALFDEPAPLTDASIGHFDRDVSPTSAPQGEGPGLANPWDLILAVEGSLVMAAGATRRYGAARGGAAAPFTFQRTAAGFASAVVGEKGRDEVWLPLWSAPAALPEVEQLVREGRAQVGRRQATTALDAVRAAGELGVARGLAGFERYAILERAGQSSLAVAAGRVAVRRRPGVELLRELDWWWRQLRRVGFADRAPDRLTLAARTVEQAMFAFADTPDGRTAQRLLVALGAAERALAVSAPEGTRPLSGVPAEPWLRLAAGHDHPAFRLAASLGSLHDQETALPALRDHLNGTVFDGSRRIYASRGATPVDREAPAPRLLAAVHARRGIEAARKRRRVPYDQGMELSQQAQLAALHDEAVLEEAVALARGIALLDHPAPTVRLPRQPAVTSPLLNVLAVAWRPPPDVPREHQTALPGTHWPSLLEARHVGDVSAAATLRLQVAGLPPRARASDLRVERLDPHRLSALLLCRLKGPSLHAVVHLPTKEPAS